MKLQYLFLFITSSVFFNNDKLLFADSADEDVASAKVNELSNNQKLIAELQDHLNKHYSKDAVQIIVNNDEAEEFYARKNLQAKLEIVAGLLIGAGILYWLYKYHKKDAGATGNGQEDGGSTLHHGKEAESNNDSIAQPPKIDVLSIGEFHAEEIDEEEEEEVPVIACKRSNNLRPRLKKIDHWLEEESYDEDDDEDYEPADEKEVVIDGWEAYA